MDTSKAIFLGLALIALVIFATDAMHPANAGAHQIGRYNIYNLGQSTNDVWVIDTSTGRYRWCAYERKCGPWDSSQ